MTPNQIIALVVGAASILYGMYMNKQAPAEKPEDSPVKPPSAKKLTAFAAQVKEVLDACPYAEWSLQKSYLLSGKAVPAIIKEEMIRLGEGKKPKEVDRGEV